VVNMPTIKPLDSELVCRMAKQCGAAVTVEEHSIIGGLGSAVAATLTENCPIPLLRVGVNDQFGQSGKPDELLTEYGLTVENIAAKVKEAINRK
ncbi:MAG: transketolase family protein, partial [Firmicutes bacterium]|nr:transketolase family protein [Bacillota bacterium]